MENRRRHKRLHFRNNVRYGLAYPPKHFSFITDFSDTGICIQTNKIYRPGTKLCLLIDTREGSFNAEGIVVWAKKAPPHLIRHMKSGMGIKFTSIAPELIDIYKDKS